MLAFLWNLGAFILALGILVTVHEYGHFWVARKAGVKVQRFSIGFGKPLFKWYDRLGTEYVIALIPLGGYVKMLDERVEEVSAQERHLSFNAKPVGARIAIVAAGPIANFLFAIVALALMYVVGVQSVKPVVGEVTPQSRAAFAGLQQYDLIQEINQQPVHDWQEVMFALMSALGEQNLNVKVQDSQGRIAYRDLDITGWKLDQQDVPPTESLGMTPYRPAITLTIAQVGQDSAAKQAGIEVGDKILALNNQNITQWQQLVDVVQASPNIAINITVERDGQRLDITAIPTRQPAGNGAEHGVLGVAPSLEKWPSQYIETRHFGPLDSIVLGTQKTWELIALSFDMIGNLLTGQVSVKNLSGPVGIAVGAGNSVSYGLVAFLSFLALISVNLGVFNLLPLPVLDGGHLMYYLIELIRKKPVSEKTQELGFKVGAMLLLALTCFALMNDVARL
ncbi:Membrane-associated zinc metalloprotease [Pseudoalteromonas luteoviolacea B = ATCC 29581]|nr:Membrane-associated zinc metalloprotease [Pseudoalteromonas luteoviolacea B = ATCC 29581]